ncbi:hypothetical protein PMI41_02115 [Phyllobacterium sp. YR531]|nr:hypothetical protein PMI41_02115 [Phyllobacterium sp. YR531]
MPLSNDNDNDTDYDPYMTRIWPYVIVFIIIAGTSLYFGWYYG